MAFFLVFLIRYSWMQLLFSAYAKNFPLQWEKRTVTLEQTRSVNTIVSLLSLSSKHVYIERFWKSRFSLHISVESRFNVIKTTDSSKAFKTKRRGEGTTENRILCTHIYKHIYVYIYRLAHSPRANWRIAGLCIHIFKKRSVSGFCWIASRVLLYSWNTTVKIGLCRSRI